MRIKPLLVSAVLLVGISLMASRAQAQVMGGGFVTVARPGFGGVVGMGNPYVTPVPYGTTVVPYGAPVVPYVVRRPAYGYGWGNRPRFYGPRPYGFRRGPGWRRW